MIFDNRASIKGFFGGFTEARCVADITSILGLCWGPADWGGVGDGSGVTPKSVHLNCF
jgi:hypothetical protein